MGELELLRVGNRLQVSHQHIRLPDGREFEDYLRLTIPDSVSIFAMTDDGNVICERQYKHGAGRSVLAMVAGAIDPGEDPEDSAKRELLEETGYVSNNWQFLVKTISHGNYVAGTIYMFLARDCQKVAEPDSGDLETIHVEVRPISEVVDAVRQGDVPITSDVATIFSALVAVGKL